MKIGPITIIGPRSRKPRAINCGICEYGGCPLAISSTEIASAGWKK